jgi:hypothetical protein
VWLSHLQVGTKLFVVGGLDVRGNVIGTVEVIDLYTAAAQTVSVALPVPLSYPAAVVSNCQVYVLGGTTQGNLVTTNVTVFQPVPSAQFTSFPFGNSLTSPRTQFSAVAQNSVISSVGGDPGGDCEDIASCPPTWVGPDCLGPSPTQCNIGYQLLNGVCTAW